MGRSGPKTAEKENRRFRNRQGVAAGHLSWWAAMRFSNDELGSRPSEELTATLYRILLDLDAGLKGAAAAIGHGPMGTGGDCWPVPDYASQEWAKAHAAWKQATCYDASIRLKLPEAYARFGAERKQRAE